VEASDDESDEEDQGHVVKKGKGRHHGIFYSSNLDS
jgi:hypothetical protein